jgi:hypothetical protein
MASGEDLLAGLVEDPAALCLESTAEQEVGDEPLVGEKRQALRDDARVGQEQMNLRRGECATGASHRVGVRRHCCSS